MERNRTHLLFLDHLRGVAILAVFAFHCLRSAFGRDELPWGAWFRTLAVSKSFIAILPAAFGWAGVAIFFVVSGFCIHLSFIRGSPGDWRGFFIRRFFRIYPPYLLAVLLLAVLVPELSAYTLHTAAASPGRSFYWAMLGSHMLLIHNFDPRLLFGINLSFWSIAVEAQLYLIYPLLLALVNRIGWRGALIAVGVLEVSLRAADGGYAVATGGALPRLFFGWPVCYWYSWAIGAAIADALVKKQRLPFRGSQAWLWAFLGIGSTFVKPLNPLSFLFFACLTATVIAKLLERESMPCLDHPLLDHLRLLGVYSYSFYLLHQPIINLVPPALYKLGIRLEPASLYAACFCVYPLIFVLSWLYYRFCELPSIAIGKLILEKTRKLRQPVLSFANEA